MFAVAGDFPCAAIGVVQWNIQWAEFKPEQPVCAGKGGFDHPVKLQVWLKRGFVQIVFGLAAFFCVIPPIPRFQRTGNAIGMQHFAQNHSI